eukprot:33391-Pelagomonas_calceolata.AAC.4
MAPSTLGSTEDGRAVSLPWRGKTLAEMCSKKGVLTVCVPKTCTGRQAHKAGQQYALGIPVGSPCNQQ